MMAKLSKATDRVLSEDALKHIYKFEAQGQQPTVESVAGTLQAKLDEVADLIDKMADHHLLVMEGDRFRLTPEGEEYALQVIRAHRLWERYLADETGFPEREWHDRADRVEHTMSSADAEALSARLGHPIHDPHGDPIPSAKGEFMPHGGQPLTRLGNGESARIVHLEDEPAVVYAQLVAEGLHPGMEVQITEVSPKRIRFQAEGEEHILAPIVATNISVMLLPEEQCPETSSCERLSDLTLGETGKVISISPACRGLERRRFMDLGILPGTVITAEMISPSGDPTAYRIRGALIGLRQEQATFINITREVEPATIKQGFDRS
jgi:DtxR family Mn-dependent transcriptional regulator